MHSPNLCVHLSPEVTAPIASRIALCISVCSRWKRRAGDWQRVERRLRDRPLCSWREVHNRLRRSQKLIPRSLRRAVEDRHPLLPVGAGVNACVVGGVNPNCATTCIFGLGKRGHRLRFLHSFQPVPTLPQHDTAAYDQFVRAHARKAREARSANTTHQLHFFILHSSARPLERHPQSGHITARASLTHPLACGCVTGSRALPYSAVLIGACGHPSPDE